MIAIVNIPFRVKIEPNVFVGEDAVDTFEITHELISGTELFNVDIKHIGDDNENTPNISLTMNYDDLKALYSSPQEVLTSIYNHYMRSIDDYVENKEKLSNPEFDNYVGFFGPDNASPVIVIFTDCENREIAQQKFLEDFKKQGYADAKVILSDMSSDEYEQMQNKLVSAEDDPYYKIFRDLNKDKAFIKNEHMLYNKNKTKDLIDTLVDTMKKCDDIEVTEF